MVDSKELQRLINWRKKTCINYPWEQRDFVEPCMEALGDNEEHIIKFLRNADAETLDWISSFTEVIYAKFQSDEMAKAIDEIFEPMVGFTINKDR